MVTDVRRCKMRCPAPHRRVIGSPSPAHNNRANQSQLSAVRPRDRPAPREDCVAGIEADTYECDVLVAGSGCSGMSAAVTAAHHGLKVLIVEKEPKFGGTTARSG